MHPTDGPVTQECGTFPQASGEPWPHTGRDYGGKRGDTVRTIASASVLFAGEGTPDWLAQRLMLVPGSTNSGKYVVLEHDGWLSLNAHLDSIDVAPGQRVSRGQRIGGLGMTGRSTGWHLHYETILEPCLNIPIFGRYDPQLQIDLEDITAATLAAAAIEPTIRKDTPLSASEVKQILAAIKAEGQKTRDYAGDLLVDGYTVGRGKDFKRYPGLAAVDIVNQQRINRLQEGIDEIKGLVGGDQK